MADDGVEGSLLLGPQGGCESEAGLCAGRTLVGDLQFAPSLGNELLQAMAQSKRQDKVARNGLIKILQVPRCIPCRGTTALALVEDRVRHGRGVLEGGHERRR